jgi:hypothetical protein
MTTYYKTLLNGKSFHGGDMEWPLPNGKPGKWMKHEGELRMCAAGFHVTSEPKNWWHPEAKCYEVEYKGKTLADDNSDKICVERVRLVRELSLDDLAKLQIFYEGSHVVTDGFALACNSATVRASGSATVTAYGSATVTAYDSATVRAYNSAMVEAYDSATVTAYGSATVRASGSATVTAYDSATVRAYNSATVRASGSATVWAYDSAKVEADGSATVNRYNGGGKTELSGNAIEIDRRTNPPTVRENFQK